MSRLGASDRRIDGRARRDRGRVIVAVVLAVQALFVVRGIWADHPIFAWRMFPEASEWRADIVRVAPDGSRTPIDDATWSKLVNTRGLGDPSVRHHADDGIENQLAFLRSAVRWYADHDGKPGVIEADVTYWRNVRAATHVVYRSST